jgi:hypothetical protein
MAAPFPICQAKPLCGASILVESSPNSLNCHPNCVRDEWAGCEVPTVRPSLTDFSWSQLVLLLLLLCSLCRCSLRLGTSIDIPTIEPALTFHCTVGWNVSAGSQPNSSRSHAACCRLRLGLKRTVPAICRLYVTACVAVHCIQVRHAGCRWCECIDDAPLCSRLRETPRRWGLQRRTRGARLERAALQRALPCRARGIVVDVRAQRMPVLQPSWCMFDATPEAAGVPLHLCSSAGEGHSYCIYLRGCRRYALRGAAAYSCRLPCACERACT